MLGTLLRAQGFTASVPAPTPPSAGADLATAGKIVVRRERKGRGGKTVTLISFERPPADLPRLAQALRKALGCGATVEAGTLVVQGDLVPRVHAWLQAHGASRIVLGS